MTGAFTDNLAIRHLPDNLHYHYPTSNTLIVVYHYWKPSCSKFYTAGCEPFENGIHFKVMWRGAFYFSHMFHQGILIA